jgi:hypothetical protein
MLNSPKLDSFVIGAAVEAGANATIGCPVPLTDTNQYINCIPIYFENKQKRNFPDKESPRQY